MNKVPVRKKKEKKKKGGAMCLKMYVCSRLIIVFIINCVPSLELASSPDRRR